jgi:hypothetical protein
MTGWELVTIPSATAATIGLLALAKSKYQQSIGRKRALRRDLSKLACGVTFEYVESLLGPALITSKDQAGRICRTYRAPEVYVLATASAEGQSIDAYAITIRRKGFDLAVSKLTSSQIDFKLPALGSEIGEVLNGSPASGLLYANGANRFGYAEAHYLANPGSYQTCILAHNDAGIGEFKSNLGVNVLTGVFTSMASEETRGRALLDDLRAKTEINTIGLAESEDVVRHLITYPSVGVAWGKVRHIPE